RQLMAEHSEIASSSLSSEVSATAALTRDVVAPFFAGVDYSVIVGATSNLTSGSSSIAWSVGHAPGDSVSLALPRPAVQVSPPDLAAGVSEETEFAVVSPDGGVATFYFAPAGAGTTYAVTTEGTTATIPNLAIIGLALPAATDYSWTVLT